MDDGVEVLSRSGADIVGGAAGVYSLEERVLAFHIEAHEASIIQILGGMKTQNEKVEYLLNKNPRNSSCSLIY